MARLVGLNTNQPHVGIAEFAARMGNYSSAWKYLKWSHDSLTATRFPGRDYLAARPQPGIKKF